MIRLKSVLATMALVLSAASVQAGGHDITDQSYKGGKAGAQASASARGLENCPLELRGMYRGNLYCRQPLLAVVAPRHAACPPDFTGMYRGNLYCVAGTN